MVKKVVSNFIAIKTVNPLKVITRSYKVLLYFIQSQCCHDVWTKLKSNAISRHETCLINILFATSFVLLENCRNNSFCKHFVKRFLDIFSPRKKLSLVRFSKDLVNERCNYEIRMRSKW